MQTQLKQSIIDTPQGQVADAILRKCVHCGFCTATCPTYLLSGNELDSPRGRIYLMKQVLEGALATEHTQLHLDRCLICRACETTCPSGVEYGRLLEIGRGMVDQQVPRPLMARWMRLAIQFVVPNTNLTTVALWTARLSKLFLPNGLRRMIPEREPTGTWPANRHPRKMIIHQGCIQRVVKPQINAAAARYLDGARISIIRTKDNCCGALGLHLGNHELFTRFAKRNIDAWWPHIEAGAEAVVSTASGCGATLKDYGYLLSDDANYAEKAARVAALIRDVSEVPGDRPANAVTRPYTKVAVQLPCSLQHGQKITHSVDDILHQHGVETTPVANGHLCCGSAGAYSLLQSEIANQLLDNKLSALLAGKPQCIVTANIGCLLHLESRSEIPVKHWVEIVAPAN